MKYFCFLCLLFFASCTLTKNTYICGDHACVDKKEFNEYFAENLVIEIKSKKIKKDTSIDLVKLNNTRLTNDTKINIKEAQYNKLSKKEKKLQLKAKKAQLKAEKKIKKNEKKKRSKNEKALLKLTNKKNKINKVNNNNSPIIDTFSKESKKKQEVLIGKKMPKDDEILQNTRSKKKANLCDEMPDCDIDKIAELLIKKGKQKEFPDITSN